MKLSIELDIEVDYEDIEDEGDELTAPYSATRINYDQDYVLRQVETKLREELYKSRTERRESPLSPAAWIREYIKEGDNLKNMKQLYKAELLMKEYAEYRLMKGE